jgi:hypothetical protein
MLVFVFLESLLSNTIRYGIQKHFLKIKNIDVVDNDAFKPANLVFQAMLVKLKREGKSTLTFVVIFDVTTVVSC